MDQKTDLASFRRYRIAAGTPPDHRAEAFLSRLEKHRFTPLDDAIEEDERAGWITAEHILDTRFTFEKVVHDPYVLFALRIDRRRVSRALLVAHVRIEEEAFRRATGSQRVPAKKRKEIREQVRDRLIRETKPVPASYPAIWAIERGVVYFGNLAAKANDEFRLRFEETFDVELEALTPFAIASVRSGGEAAEIDRLLGTSPTKFAEAATSAALAAA